MDQMINVTMGRIRPAAPSEIGYLNIFLIAKI